MNFRKQFNSSKIESEIDVKKLFPTKAGVWVEISTVDRSSAVLIDCYDGRGRFLESFFLGTGKQLMAVTDDSAFCQEKNEDESIPIVKYRIKRQVENLVSET